MTPRQRGQIAAVAASAYDVYRNLFRKNPEVVHEIQQADEREKALDEVFQTTSD